MTRVQWFFHYIEALKAEKQKNNMFDILLSYMELVGTMANPESGKKLQEAKEKRKHEQELNADNFAKMYEEMKKSIPAELKVTVEGADNKYILPKFDREEYKKRQLGIDKGGEK
jgi:hypothetical protein